MSSDCALDLIHFIICAIFQIMLFYLMSIENYLFVKFDVEAFLLESCIGSGWRYIFSLHVVLTSTFFSAGHLAFIVLGSG